jgi:hypothetical protein
LYLGTISAVDNGLSEVPLVRERHKASHKFGAYIGMSDIGPSCFSCCAVQTGE